MNGYIQTSKQWFDGGFDHVAYIVVYLQRTVSTSKRLSKGLKIGY